MHGAILKGHDMSKKKNQYNFHSYMSCLGQCVYGSNFICTHRLMVKKHLKTNLTTFTKIEQDYKKPTKVCIAKLHLRMLRKTGTCLRICINGSQNNAKYH